MMKQRLLVVKNSILVLHPEKMGMRWQPCPHVVGCADDGENNVRVEYPNTPKFSNRSEDAYIRETRASQKEGIYGQKVGEIDPYSPLNLGRNGQGSSNFLQKAR